jgi:hypothetical protein
VALAGGTKAYHGPDIPLAGVALIGVRDNRRIEKRGRFERVFLGEIRPDQHPALLRYFPVGKHQPPDMIIVSQKHFLDVRVTVGEIGEHVDKQPVDFPGRKRHDARYDFYGPLLASREERADKDT